ncbi:hypothetical protein GCM10009760_12710 [Kitasatospora kazusensis]|uniref:OmpR/PhoB-type domain-containing protein n=1 Tax=Kitasatospora kazusensis TaxID=407974 RepID=A0ABN2Z0G1_9ACTN
MSSSTAILTLPSATPHLRAVRSLPPISATSPATERRHPARQPAGHPQPTPAELFTSLPAGATVVATLPQSAIPQGLLAQYGAQLGEAAAGRPVIGYLVLVPTEAPTTAAGPVLAPAAGSVPAPRPAGRPAHPAARGISIDLDRRNAWVDGELLDLTYLEFELLAHLTEHPQRVHTRDHLVSAVWGYGHVGDGRTVDVHVARLRRKLGHAYRNTIVTVRRVGYKYAPAADR